MHLVDHMVRNSGVLDHREEKQDSRHEHCRQHGRIALVEWVLPNKVDEPADWNDELEVQLSHSPPLGPVVVQQVVAVL